jgi:hypothetical protein
VVVTKFKDKITTLCCLKEFFTIKEKESKFVLMKKKEKKVTITSPKLNLRKELTLGVLLTLITDLTVT